MREPLKFRSLFLLSGLHFASQRGGLGEYAATQYYHIAEGIRTLNKTLSADKLDSRTRAICMELISVLAINEVSPQHHSWNQSHQLLSF